MADTNINSLNLYNGFVAKESKSVQREQVVLDLQSSPLKDTTNEHDIILDQTLQLLSSGQSLQNIEKIAKSQIEKGYLDVKV